ALASWADNGRFVRLVIRRVDNAFLVHHGRRTPIPWWVQARWRPEKCRPPYTPSPPRFTTSSPAPAGAPARRAGGATGCRAHGAGSPARRPRRGPARPAG